MPPVGFEPTISAGERPKTYALDRAAIGTGSYWNLRGGKNISKMKFNKPVVSYHRHPLSTTIIYQ